MSECTGIPNKVDKKCIVNLNYYLCNVFDSTKTNSVQVINYSSSELIGSYKFSDADTKMDVHCRLWSDATQGEDQDLSQSLGINTSQIFNTDLFGCLFHAPVARRQSVYNAQGWCPAGRINDFNKSAAFSMQIPSYSGTA